MRRWFKLNPVRCKVCNHILRGLLEILRDGGKCYDDGTFECETCVKAGETLIRFGQMMYPPIEITF